MKVIHSPLETVWIKIALNRRDKRNPNQNLELDRRNQTCLNRKTKRERLQFKNHRYLNQSCKCKIRELKWRRWCNRFKECWKRYAEPDSKSWAKVGPTKKIKRRGPIQWDFQCFEPTWIAKHWKFWRCKIWAKVQNFNWWSDRSPNRKIVSGQWGKLGIWDREEKVYWGVFEGENSSVERDQVEVQKVRKGVGKAK